jgi:hypothetical protein
MIFLKYLQQGKPLLWYDILYIKRKVCTDLRVVKEKKNTQTIYLYKLIKEEKET